MFTGKISGSLICFWSTISTHSLKQFPFHIQKHKLINLDPYLTPFTKINSKWIKHLNIRPDTMELLEENIEKRLLDIGLGNDFLF